jgi:hypothetical protein
VLHCHSLLLQDEDLCLVYRPSPNNAGNTYYTLKEKSFQEAAYKAKVSSYDSELRGMATMLLVH